MKGYRVFPIFISATQNPEEFMFMAVEAICTWWVVVIKFQLRAGIQVDITFGTSMGTALHHSELKRLPTIDVETALKCWQTK